MNGKIIAVGNPGSGKSTILNYLAGKVLFQSGISIGKGLTYELDEKVGNNGMLFCDTPGLADHQLREQAAAAISKTLQVGGKSRVMFFCTQQQGRVINQDVTTIKMVLEAAPEIGDNYSIIVNQVDKFVYELITGDKVQRKKFVDSLFIGIGVPEKKVKQTSQVFFLERNEELTNKNNVLAADSFFPGLKNFVATCKEVDLKPDPSIKVHAREFEMYEEAVAKVQEEMRKNKIEFEEKVKQLDKKKSQEFERKLAELQAQSNTPGDIIWGVAKALFPPLAIVDIAVKAANK